MCSIKYLFLNLLCFNLVFCSSIFLKRLSHGFSTLFSGLYPSCASSSFSSLLSYLHLIVPVRSFCREISRNYHCIPGKIYFLPPFLYTITLCFPEPPGNLQQCPIHNSLCQIQHCIQAFHTTLPSSISFGTC